MVTKQLLSADKSLQVLALLRGPVPELARLRRCHVVEGDLFDHGPLEQTIRSSDLVVNLAARNPGGEEEDWSAREEFFLLNALGAGLVAAKAEKYRLPLIHFSTVSVYETAAYVAGRQMTESDSMPCLGQEIGEFYERVLDYLAGRVTAADSLADNNSLRMGFKKHLAAQSYPRSTPIYGMSKLIGESLSLAVNGRTCSIRMSDVYGPGHESRGVIIEHLLQILHSATAIVDFGVRKCVYLLYIDDIRRLLAALVYRLLSNESGLPGILNFCGVRIDSTSMRSHLEKLCRARRLSLGVQASPLVRSQFDRRYSRVILDQFMPAFELTDFSTGLDKTFDALGAAPERLSARARKDAAPQVATD